MTWTNFTQESKKFCSYEQKNFKGKVLFWIYYPRALWRFWLAGRKKDFKEKVQ